MGGKLNINRASTSELDGLPGVGPVLAKRIVEYRATNGSFTSIDELQKVAGIGPSKFSELRKFVTTRSAIFDYSFQQSVSGVVPSVNHCSLVKVLARDLFSAS